MDAPVGATVGLRGRGVKSSEVFPSDTFDFRQMQEQLDFPDKFVTSLCPGDLGMACCYPRTRE